jgi:hypothetical protein
VGFQVNFSGSREYLFTVYYLRANPLLHYLQDSDVENIVSDTPVPIELATIFHQKNFFYSENLLRGAGPLIDEFLKRRISTFFLITGKESCDFPAEIPMRNGKRIGLKYRVIPVIGLYRLTQISVVNLTEASMIHPSVIGESEDMLQK